MKAAFLKFGSFGRLDLAVDLGQRLFAAHRQDRVAEGDQESRSRRSGSTSFPAARSRSASAGESLLISPSGSSGLPGRLVELGDGPAVASIFGHELARLRIAPPDFALLARDAIDALDRFVLGLRAQVGLEAGRG